MRIEEAIKKAIEGGWSCEEWKTVLVLADFKLHKININLNGFGFLQFYVQEDRKQILRIEQVFLNPLFWHSLFGTKCAKIKAIEFINHIFDGKTTEQFFDQISDLGTEQ